MKTCRQTTFRWFAGLVFLLSAQAAMAETYQLPNRCLTCIESPVVVTSTPSMHAAVAIPVVISPSSQLASTLPLVITPPEASASNQTFLVVNCPHEAEVRIDGYLTNSTGPSRLYHLSFDKFPNRRVAITMTKYGDTYREEFEYTEIAHCQQGKTTTISVTKEEMKRKKICEKDCNKTEDSGFTTTSSDPSANQDDRLITELLVNAPKDKQDTLIKWELEKRHLAVKIEVGRASRK